MTGIGIAESCVDIAHGVSNGDWVEAGLGVLGGRVESLTRSGEPVPPGSTSDLFAADDAEFAMAVRFGRQLWTTSFYSPTEIDLQCDPRDVKSREDLEQIADFMRDLNRLTGKRVVLVTETLAPRETTPYLSVG